MTVDHARHNLQLATVLLPLLLSPLPANSQSPIDVDSGEARLLQRTAPAPRALAMGIEGIALAAEGSTAAINPAGLTAIRRFELSAAIAGTSLDQETLFRGRRMSDQDFSLNLTEIWFVVPMPVSRGGLALALGYHHQRSAFQQVHYSGYGPVDDTDRRQEENLRWRGGPAAFTVAGAVDLSPRVTAGLAVDFWSGTEKFERRFEYGFPSDEAPGGAAELALEDDYAVDHSGIGVRGGLMVRAAPRLRFGVVLDAPFDLERQGNYHSTLLEESPDGELLSRTPTLFDVDERLRLPWSIGLGFAWRAHRLLLFGVDGRWTDLPRLEYAVRDSSGTLSPVWPTAADDAPYRMGWEAGGGLELIVPSTTLRIRSGYRHSTPTYKGESATSGRDRISGGIGWIVDAAFALDLAATVEIYEGRQPAATYQRQSTRTRIAAGLAYRF
jgi:long-subunit fatty acid transport protein